MFKIGVVIGITLLCFACAHVEPPKEAPKLVKPSVEIPARSSRRWKRKRRWS
jgi:hypothetical protein